MSEITIRTQLLPGDLGLVAWLHGQVYTHEQETATALYLRQGFRLTEEKESVGFGKVLRERRYALELVE